MSATEVEAAAMHDAIMHWSNYLSNGIKFEVIVDHQALVYLTTAAALEGNKKVLNMILRLQGFWFDVKYRKGEKHTDADALSRLFRYQDNASITFPDAPSYFDSVQEADIALLKRRLSLQPHRSTEVTTADILQLAAELQGKMSLDEDLFLDLTSEETNVDEDPTILCNSGITLIGVIEETDGTDIPITPGLSF